MRSLERSVLARVLRDARVALACQKIFQLPCNLCSAFDIYRFRHFKKSSEDFGLSLKKQIFSAILLLLL